MKVLLLAALVSQLVGRPQLHQQQQQHRLPGNTWSNPGQPTRWSDWSSVENGDPSSYDSYNSYNPYGMSPYNPYIPNNPDNPYNSYDSYVPGSGGDVNSVSGSVGSPVIPEVGLDQLGSLLSPEIVYDQGWNTHREWPSQNLEQPASPCESTVCWPSVRGTNAGIVRPWSLRGRFRHRSRNYG